MEQSVVRIHDVTKMYGAFAAVDGISFDVARGEVFGFLGPNGSGKTTTIRMLTGSIAPTAGTISVLGNDAVRHPDRIRTRNEDMTVAENLRFYGGIHNLSKDVFAERREYILDMADLRGRESALTRDLSTGCRQRLTQGVSSIQQPELLFLDEPTSGVDPG